MTRKRESNVPTTAPDWRYLLRRVRSVMPRAETPDAEDLLQSAFVRLLSYEADVVDQTGFVIAASRSIAVDGFRKAQRLGLLPLSEADAFPSGESLPDEIYAARKRLAEVIAALDRLPARTRRIFLMHRLDGTKYRDIALREGISSSAVEKHITRAVLYITNFDSE